MHGVCLRCSSDNAGVKAAGAVADSAVAMLQLLSVVIPNMGRRAAAFREHVVTTAVLSTALALAVLVPNVEVRLSRAAKTCSNHFAAFKSRARDQCLRH